MSFFQAANSPLIWGLAIGGLVFVAGFAVLSMAKSWRRARTKGWTNERLWSIVRAAITVTIVPALAIIIGLFALVPLLGTPWPWWRLSVLGSLTYETMAASQALESAGLSINALDGATAKDFVLIMYVMTIGIMGGMCVSPFITKPMQYGSMQLKSGDRKWGALSSTVFFLVVVAVYDVPYFTNWMSRGSWRINERGFVSMLTFLTGIIVTFGIERIARGRLVALRTFELGLSLIIAMASSVLWTGIIR